VTQPDDYAYLYYGLFTAPENLFRSRLHGDTPGLDGFVRAISERCFAQFLGVNGSSGSPFAHFGAYAANLRDGTCSFEVTAAPDVMTTDVFREALSLFLTYLFRMWPFRKAYTHVTEFNLSSVSWALGALFEEEGLLRDFEYYAGRFWDVHVVATLRPHWETPTLGAALDPPFSASARSDG
jgi:RimJ/RimL family protein N-acetyltransferase